MPLVCRRSCWCMIRHTRPATNRLEPHTLEGGPGKHSACRGLLVLYQRCRRHTNTRVVPPMGFEPTISALKGRRPRPLDDGGPVPARSRASVPAALSPAAQVADVPPQIMLMMAAPARAIIAAAARSPPNTAVATAV